MDIFQRQNQQNLLKDYIWSIRGSRFKGMLLNVLAIYCGEKLG